MALIQIALIWVVYAVVVALLGVTAAILIFLYQNPKERAGSVTTVSIFTITALLATVLLLPVDVALVSSTTKSSTGTRKEWATQQKVDEITFTLTVVWYTLFSLDANRKPLRAQLSISTNYAGTQPGLWDGSGTWQPVGSGFELLRDRLGVWINAANPNAWNIQASRVAGAPYPAGVVRGVEDQVAGGSRRFTLRLTCVIEGDQVAGVANFSVVLFKVGNVKARRQLVIFIYGLRRPVDPHVDTLDHVVEIREAIAPVQKECRCRREHVQFSPARVRSNRLCHSWELFRIQHRNVR